MQKHERGRLKSPTLAAMSALAMIFAAAPADADPAETCRLVETVPLRQLDGDEIVAACRDALAQDPDSPDLLYAKGLGHEANGDRLTSVHWLSQAARLGHAESVFIISRSAADDGARLALLRRAAELGHGMAAYDLHHAYNFGVDGAQRDSAKSIQWLRRAAELDYPTAQMELAEKYVMGIELPQDSDQAFAWYRRYAAHGPEHAEKAQSKAESAVAFWQRQHEREPRAQGSYDALIGMAILGLGAAALLSIGDGESSAAATGSGSRGNPGTAPFQSAPDPQAGIDMCLNTFSMTGTAAGCF